MDTALSESVINSNFCILNYVITIDLTSLGLKRVMQDNMETHWGLGIECSRGQGKKCLSCRP